MLVPLILGLVSSLHCVGMCGPLALMVSGNRSGKTGSIVGNWANPLIYNLGRVTTYAAFGLIFGLIGRSFAWFGWQQKISIAMGVIILIFLFLPGLINSKNHLSNHINALMNKIRSMMSKLLFKGKPASLYAFGLLNGLLPCGMVYMAIAGAIAAGTAVDGTIFMILFGLGTLPAMWAVSYFGTMVSQSLRQQFRKIFPAVMVVLALMLILRGLNLDIPFLSPSLHLSHSSAVICHD